MNSLMERFNSIKRRVRQTHDEAYRVAFGVYLRKGFFPPRLMEIVEATKSIKAFLDYTQKYDQDQPRVPAGNGRVSGRWTSGEDGGGDILDNIIGDITGGDGDDDSDDGADTSDGENGVDASQPPYSPDKPGWHNYVVGPTLICSAEQNCSSQEIADQLSRFAVPGQNPAAPVVNGQVSLAVDPRTDLPAGEVRTTISDDGLTLINKTQPDHIFYDGQVVRGAYQGSDGGWYVLTHGYGNDVIPGMAEINQWQGPKIFETIDRNLRQNIANHR